LCHPEFSSLKIVNQIHDEYMFECPKEEAEKCGLIVKYVMELALFPSEIPFLAQTYICENWRDKENEVGHLPASGKKVTVAMLSQEDKDWCAQFIPVDMPLFGKRKEGTRQLSIEEYRKIKGDL